MRATSIPASNEVSHQQIVVGSFSGESHHDARYSTRGSGTKKGISVAVEGSTSFSEALGGRLEVGYVPVERGPDAFHGGEHVGFAPPQRRKAAFSQPALKLAKILVAKREVVDEVDRILSVGNVGPGDVFTMDCLQVMHEGFKPSQLSADRVPLGIARRPSATYGENWGNHPADRSRGQQGNSMSWTSL